MELYNIAIAVVVFIFGLAFGSFINAFVYRLNSNKTLLGRSECPNCKNKLKSLDLIPVFSYLFLKGKCRYCNKKISLQYPLVELSTGIIFLLTYFKIDSLFEQFDMFFYIDLVLYLFVAVILIIVFIYDYKYYIIPNKVIFPAVLIVLLFLIIKGIIIGDIGFLLPYLYSVALIFGFFLMIFLISRGKWIGAGDVKFGILMGLIIPWPNSIAALFLSFVIGAMVGLILIAVGRKKIKEKVPFGTFLVIGTFIAFFAGDYLIDWYLDLIF